MACSAAASFLRGRRRRHAPLCGIEGVGETVEAVGKFPEPIRVCRGGVREAAQVVGPMRMPVAIHLDVHEGGVTGWALGEGALFEARTQNHRRATAR